MNKEWLKALRIIVPGAMILIVIMLFKIDNCDIQKLLSSISWKEPTASTVAIFLLGGLYYMLGIRKSFMQTSLDKILNNNKHNLLAPFLDDPEIKKFEKKLKKGNTLQSIIYNHVDNDKSLKQQRSNIYFNGLFLSSAADMSAIGLIGAIAYCIAFLFTKSQYYFLVFIILLALAAISFFILLPKVSRQHMELCKGQTDFILLHSKDKVEAKIKDIIQEEYK